MSSTFTLRSLDNEEIVRVCVITFSGDETEFACEGKVLNQNNADPFSEYLSKEQSIGWKNVKKFRVETFQGSGQAYERSHKNGIFRPTDW